jgi:uroporphyrinogen-III synthase
MALRRAAVSLERYDWLVLASVRALHAVMKARDGAPLPGHLRGAAVGSQSARALREAGLTDVLTAVVPGAHGLLSALRSEVAWARQRVLLPRAAGGSPVLASGLRELGATADEIEAYVMVARPERAIRSAWQEASPAAAVIASPAAARALAGAIGAPVLRELRLVIAIGATTAAALGALDVPCRISPAASFEALAADLTQAMSERKVAS